MPSNKRPAVILGMTETCLAAARSLGRAGVRVIGVDCAPGIGFRSKYVEGRICPNPLSEHDEFVSFLVELAAELKAAPVLIFTADDFALAVSRARDQIDPHFLMNLSDNSLLERIIDKSLQQQAAQSAGIPTPKTWLLNSQEALESVASDLSYPVFVKGCSSFRWCEVTCDVKGFIANNQSELSLQAAPIMEKSVPLVAQEIIVGPDTNHVKVCVYMTSAGEPALVFTLRKLRQFPPRFGVGSCVESIGYPELAELGVKLFKGLGYRGIGSAEFKLDERDGVLKLIELNPRLWQQNALAARCGMDFARAYYADLTGLPLQKVENFEQGIKWVNLELDLRSFQGYADAKELTYRKWRQSLKGPKIVSDFDRDDIAPFVYNARQKNWLSRYFREWVRGTLFES